jgi:hypothetical protein
MFLTDKATVIKNILTVLVVFYYLYLYSQNFLPLLYGLECLNAKVSKTLKLPFYKESNFAQDETSLSLKFFCTKINKHDNCLQFTKYINKTRLIKNAKLASEMIFHQKHLSKFN